MALKARKELELKVHEEFYKTVNILTLCHPPTLEFQEVFKKDMFIKNNKAGFHQVVYYLLNLLDSDMLKQKVPTWPLCDVRLESQFRNEVMSYINELNNIYENANIPKLATSHLISPGGFKFIKFMFKLSQLVLCEQLKRKPKRGVKMLLFMTPCKQKSITKQYLEVLQIMMSKINEGIDQRKTYLEHLLEASKREAQKLVEERHRTSQLYKDGQVKLLALKEQIKNEFPNFLNEQDRRVVLMKKLNTLQQLKEKFSKCEELGMYLSSSQAKLEHNKELKIPAQISHIIRCEGDALDLCSLFEGCNMLSDRKRLEIRPLESQDLARQIQRFECVNDHFIAINTNMAEMCVELDKLSSKTQKETGANEIPNKEILLGLQMGNLTDNDSDSASSTPLAEPLPPSPSSSSNHN